MMNSRPRLNEKPLLAVLILFPIFARAQTLDITNSIQTYGSLTNTTVTMTGRCELWVTATNDPIPGCVINLNSSDAWLFLPGIRPSVVASTYLSQVLVNGGGAVSGNNVRVVEYALGTVVIPHAPGFQPLQVFTGQNFTGTSALLSQYAAYSDGALGVMNNTIRSFKLKRGYMATLAQNGNGSGISRTFVAQDGDLDVSIMPFGLNNSVSFVRVFPWRWTAKKGIAGTIQQTLNVGWFYDWNIDQTSSADWEYVPIRQTRFWPGLGQNWQALGSTHLLGYNEPDNPSQDAYCTVADGIASWPDLLGTGLRVGSPAPTDGGRASWLYPFIQQADAAGLRVDFVAVHYYQCVDPANPSAAASALYNFLKATYDQTKRPIWVTEWNNGANWTTCGDPTYAQQQAAVSAMLDMLESAPFVERYSLYNWVEDVRGVITNNALTPAGITYRDKPSHVGYVQDGLPGSQSFARYQFQNDVLDSAGLGNNGIAIGIPTYTNGQFGQAIQLDGTNSYVQLPAKMGNSSGFSFAAWLNWDGGANWQRIFDFGNDTTHYLFLSPSSGSGTLRFAINNGAGEQLIETTALPIGQWRHVTVTLSGNTARLYTNGVLATSSTNFTITPSQFNPRRNYLGKSQFAADPLFTGRMDEVVITHYALSAAEIAALQTNQPPQFPSVGDGIWTSGSADGIWSDPARWSDGLVANGAGYTADFSAVDITANRTVTLDTNRSIGALKFGDLAGVQNWIVTSDGTSTLTLDTASATQPSIVVSQNAATLATPVSSGNGFVKTGPGTLILSGTNSFSGTVLIDTSSTTVNEGNVRAAGPNALFGVTNILIRNNNGGSSTFQLDGSSGNVAVASRLGVSCRNTNIATIQNLSGTNTLSGQISVDVGGNMFNIQSDAGQLNITGGIRYIGSLTGGRNYIFSGAGNHLVTGQILNSTNTAPIGLTKSGTGTLTLTAVNTYTNTTTVNGGALLVNGSLTASPVTVASGGTLGGLGTITRPVTVQSGGAIAPGASFGKLTVNNTITLQAGSTTLLEISKAPLTNDVLRTTSVLTYAGTLVVTNLSGELAPGDTFTLFQAASFVSSFLAYSLPPLDTGLSWNAAGLTNGVLSVIATNPPAIGSYLLAGDGSFQLNGSGSASQIYTLEATTNLAAAPIEWTPVTNTTADTAGLFQLFDAGATNYPERYYRISAPAQ
jgi:autotransporter-associated beta strand protein